jgi:hypothetical protein
MAVNKYIFKVGGNDLSINLGFGTTIDETGREDLIKGYEDSVVEKLINPTKDYEITRYRHAPLSDNTDESPDIYYKFDFYDYVNGSYVSVPPTPWVPPASPMPTPYGYNFQGFENVEIGSSNVDIVKSFFKLDFYNVPNRTEQKFYMSNVINYVKGEKVKTQCISLDCITTPPWSQYNLVGPSDNVTDTLTGRLIYDTTMDIRLPEFHFDMDVNDSGYFFYWLKESTYLNINTFFMSAKFFNGRDGRVTRFTNVLPTSLPNPTSFDPALNMYYKLILDKNNFTYWIEDLLGNRVGTNTTPIEFWEYINPI